MSRLVRFCGRVQLHLLLQKGRLINSDSAFFFFCSGCALCPVSLSQQETGCPHCNRLYIWGTERGTSIYHTCTNVKGRYDSEDSSVRFGLRRRKGLSFNSAFGDLTSLFGAVGETNLTACEGLPVEWYVQWDSTFHALFKRLWECTWVNLGWKYCFCAVQEINSLTSILTCNHISIIIRMIDSAWIRQ